MLKPNNLLYKKFQVELYLIHPKNFCILGNNKFEESQWNKLKKKSQKTEKDFCKVILRSLKFEILVK